VGFVAVVGSGVLGLDSHAGSAVKPEDIEGNSGLNRDSFASAQADERVSPSLTNPFPSIPGRTDSAVALDILRHSLGRRFGPATITLAV